MLEKKPEIFPEHPVVLYNERKSEESKRSWGYYNTTQAALSQTENILVVSSRGKMLLKILENDLLKGLLALLSLYVDISQGIDR